MDASTQARRVTIRLTPYQARRLWKLRTHDVPEGGKVRSVTEVLVSALLTASAPADGAGDTDGEGAGANVAENPSARPGH